MVVNEADPTTHGQSHDQSHVQSEPHDQSIIEEHVVEDGSKIHDDEDGALSEQVAIEVDSATHDQSHGQSHDQSITEEHMEHTMGDGSKIHDDDVNGKENSETLKVGEDASWQAKGTKSTWFLTCVRNEVDLVPLAFEDGEDDKLVEDGHSNDGDDSFDSSFDEAEVMSDATGNDTNLNNKVSVRSRRHNVSKPARLRDCSDSSSKRTKPVSICVSSMTLNTCIYNEINTDPDTS